MESNNKQTVWGWFATVFFYGFAAVVIVWTGSLTLDMMQIVLPGQTLTHWFALVLFDVGAFVWSFTYIYKAKGTAQHAITLGMALMDLLGVVFISAADLVMGGQELMAIPKNMGTWVMVVMILWTAGAACAIYFYHYFEPKIQIELRTQAYNDQVIDKAFKDMDQMFAARAAQLANIMASEQFRKQLHDMNFDPSLADGIHLVTAPAQADQPQPTVTYPSTTDMPKLVPPTDQPDATTNP